MECPYNGVANRKEFSECEETIQTKMMESLSKMPLLTDYLRKMLINPQKNNSENAVINCPLIEARNKLIEEGFDKRDANSIVCSSCELI